MQFDFFSDKTKEFMGQFGGKDDTKLSKEEEKNMEGRFKEGKMSFDDFLFQANMMQKAGSMQGFLSNTPFGEGGNAPSKDQLDAGEAKVRRYRKYIEEMTEEERSDPDRLIKEAEGVPLKKPTPTLDRIAESQKLRTTEEIVKFLYEFKFMRKAAASFAKGESPDKIKADMQKEQEEIAPPMNRQQRRNMMKQKKKKKTSGGFR
jgi:signal recognition particle GTPase